MKVILLKDVAKIGRRSEIVEVPNGYALNKLLPNGLAEAATPANVKRVQAQAAKVEATKADTNAKFAEAISALKDKTIEVKASANDKGHLFEAVKPAAIVAAADDAGVTITENEVVIATPLKEVGEHVILLQEGENQTEIKVTVVAA